MNWSTIRPVAARVLPGLNARREESGKTLTTREQGRRAILFGWVLTMVGIVGYIVAMSRAGENAEILDALTSQGVLGWGSLLVMLTGVGVWIVGNCSMLHELSETPRTGSRDED